MSPCLCSKQFAQDLCLPPQHMHLLKSQCYSSRRNQCALISCLRGLCRHSDCQHRNAGYVFFCAKCNVNKSCVPDSSQVALMHTDADTDADADADADAVNEEYDYFLGRFLQR